MWVWLILFIGAVILLVLERFSLKDPEKRLDVESRFQKRYVEVDETIPLVIRVTNKGYMPVFYFHLRQSVAKGLEAKDPTFAQDHWREYPSSGVLRDTFYLSSRRSISRTYELTATRRGAYSLSGAYLSVGDLFGIKETPFKVEGSGEVLVFPKRSTRSDIPVSLGNLFGDVSVQRFIHEDPVLIAGFKEYTGHEPWKSISWTQSARANRMLVKTYDHTAEHTVTVVLDIEQAGEALEECLSLTRTVCEDIEKKGMSWGFCTDAALYRMQAMSDPSQGTGRTHLYHVLEALSHIDGYCTATAEAFLKKLITADLHSAGFLIILPAPRPELTPLIRRLKANTGSVIYLLYAEGGMLKC